MPTTDLKFRVFVLHSTASKDAILADELLGHFRPLERFAGLDVWSESRIQAGSEICREIERAIDQADVALVLLSPDFFASDALHVAKVPRLSERHLAGKLRVIPVLLRSCLWEAHPWLAALQPLPRDGMAIASHTGDERDRALTDVVREISKLMTVSASTPSGSAPPSGQERSKASASTTSPAIDGGGSTITGLGIGNGATVNGSVDRGQVVEPRPARDAATSHSRGGSQPLVVLGPHLIAEGECNRPGKSAEIGREYRGGPRWAG
jgi:hypothetical protein